MTVDALRTRLERTVASAIPHGARVAILDLPNHPNSGDNAIWLGELALLRRRQARIAYVCETHGYDAHAVRRAVGPNGVVLLHGGGNFGDEWPGYQELRERVVCELPDLSVVQLPQSLQFGDAAARQRAAAALADHPRLTVLCRDEPSANTARTLAPRATVELCPDAAFALRPRQRRVTPPGPPLWLARTDRERRAPRLAPPNGRGRVVDWPDPGAAERRLRALSAHAGQRATKRAWLAPATVPALAALHRGLATQRVHEAMALLASAPTVVTDRLHAHILCLLLGVPHVVVDTGYGKLRRFVEAWTHDSPLMRMASDAAEAQELCADPRATREVALA
jgi:exopolysaccharide biosynthesis predicted pyruvyltransferase EpsI